MKSMIDNVPTEPLDMGFDVDKKHGHVTIILTDVNTGEQEIHEDNNMMTNAIREYFKNCGFLNYPNANQSNMVEELLGGILCLDTALTESADLVHIPAGVKMTANGGIGCVNTGNTPSELGTCSTGESTQGGVTVPDTGWQPDGSYQMMYDFTAAQGLGTIACVCLTGKNYGCAGEGNARSLVRNGTRYNIASLTGSQTSYSGVPGLCFDVDLVNSTVLSFDIGTEEAEVEGETVTLKKAWLRKYRIPYSKINLKGTASVPIKLDEQEVAISEEDWDMMAAYIDQGSSTVWNDRRKVGWQPHGHNLLIWTVYISSDRTPQWGSGSYIQYLWTLTPSGVLTRQTVTNTYGEDLQGLQAAIFDGNYCFFIQGGGTQGYGYSNRWVDSRTVYVWNRTTNEMFSIDNSAAGTTSGNTYSTGANDYYANFIRQHGSGDGRIVVTGGSGGAVIDAVLRQAYPTNANSGGSTEYGKPHNAINGAPLIRTSYGASLNLERDQTYIASIFNLETPIVKTADKAMKVIYRITFDEE